MNRGILGIYDISWPELAGLTGVGVLAGAINTIAGGGSLICLPALIFFGLPANVANATNRIGVLIQSAIATRQFQRADKLDASAAVPLLIATSFGALVGSWLSVDIDEQMFRRVIGVVMLIMLGVLIFRPKRWLMGEDNHDRKPGGWQLVAFFFIGGYGGFLQAGVGLFLLAALVLLAGKDLVRANAIKALLVGMFTIPALVVFVISDLVAWIPGFALALGSGIGGWIGTKMTVSWGPQFVRWVLFVVIVVSSTRLLDLW